MVKKCSDIVRLLLPQLCTKLLYNLVEAAYQLFSYKFEKILVLIVLWLRNSYTESHEEVSLFIYRYTDFSNRINYDLYFLSVAFVDCNLDLLGPASHRDNISHGECEGVRLLIQWVRQKSCFFITKNSLSVCPIWLIMSKHFNVWFNL